MTKTKQNKSSNLPHIIVENPKLPKRMHAVNDDIETIVNEQQTKRERNIPPNEKRWRRKNIETEYNYEQNERTSVTLVESRNYGENA